MASNKVTPANFAKHFTPDEQTAIDDAIGAGLPVSVAVLATCAVDSRKVSGNATAFNLGAGRFAILGSVTPKVYQASAKGESGNVTICSTGGQWPAVKGDRAEPPFEVDGHAVYFNLNGYREARGDDELEVLAKAREGKASSKGREAVAADLGDL